MGTHAKVNMGQTTFKVQVIADNSGKWAGNGLAYETRELAEDAARDLADRWSLVREWRVIECREVPKNQHPVEDVTALAGALWSTTKGDHK